MPTIQLSRFTYKLLQQYAQGTMRQTARASANGMLDVHISDDVAEAIQTLQERLGRKGESIEATINRLTREKLGRPTN